MIEFVVEGLERYQSMAEQVLGNERVRAGLARLVLDVVYEGLRRRAA